MGGGGGMKIALGWQVSSYFGWGVYGLNIALEWANDPTIEASGCIGKLDDIVVDNLRRRVLVPFMRRSLQPVARAAIAIDALGNECGGSRDTKALHAAIFFELPLSSTAIERAKRYETIIAGSTWNANVLRSHGLTNVETIFQGVDRSLFHWAPKRDLYPGKFLIFSGGKAEPRKGQDLVVKAFRIFAEKHKDAMLVTAWHSPWPQLAKGMDLDLSKFADRVIDVGAVPNGQMAPIYRECDVALFPNRAEGGTNLVAMECIACGVPTIVSSNTGHLDLLDVPGVMGLQIGRPPLGEWSEWGECDVDEIVHELETAYRNHGGVRVTDPMGPRFHWSTAARQIADLVRNHQPQKEVA